MNWLGLVISSTQMFRSFFEGRSQGNSSRDGAVTNPKGKEDTSEPACPSPSLRGERVQTRTVQARPVEANEREKPTRAEAE